MSVKHPPTAKVRFKCFNCDKETAHRVISTMREIQQQPLLRAYECIDCLTVKVELLIEVKK